MAARLSKHGQSVIGLLRALNVEASGVPRTRPIYRRIVELIDRGIARGSLAPGFRLPPERDFAAALRVSRTTIVAAYRELESRGLARGYVGRGTFVAAKRDGDTPFAWRGKISATALQTTDSTLRDLMRHAADPSIVSLAAGEPALDVFPVEAFRARRELIELARRFRVPIVEDETYCELALGSTSPPPALHTLDEEGLVVIRVNSFSKVLAPGLRLGWIGAARPIIEQLAIMKQ